MGGGERGHIPPTLPSDSTQLAPLHLFIFISLMSHSLTHTHIPSSLPFPLFQSSSGCPERTPPTHTPPHCSGAGLCRVLETSWKPAILSSLSLSYSAFKQPKPSKQQSVISATCKELSKTHHRTQVHTHFQFTSFPEPLLSTAGAFFSQHAPLHNKCSGITGGIL